jgi:transcription elongation GreA/GreB family factor
MNVANIKQWVAEGNLNAVESAWMEGAEQGAPLEEMRDVLAALVKGDRGDEAETLAWMFLSDAVEQREPADALEVVSLLLPPLPGNQELREMAVGLYRKVHGEAEHFEDMLRASGLAVGQATRRAVRTLNICLAIRPGTYMANRYDSQVVRVEEYNAIMGQFRLTEPNGQTIDFEPKLLADEFDPVDDIDFRVLCGFRREELGGRVQKDIASVLTGICLSHGGQINAAALKDLLVPDHIESAKWSGWWGRARTAAKRSEQLSLEGRNPAVIHYHPHGRSLEDELARPVADARVPHDFFVILQQYVRETKGRKVPVETAFVAPILNTLAEQAQSFRRRRPADALAASLIIDALTALGLPRPNAPYPTAVEELAGMDDPAAAVADLGEPSLWPAAFDALTTRDDAGEHFEKLLYMLPWNQLNDIAARLRTAGREDAIERAAEAAAADPPGNLDLCIWLWRGPAVPVAGAGTMLDQLSRLLSLTQEIARDWDMHRTDRRDAFQEIRAAFIADRCRSFRAALHELDDDVAETVKRRVERCDGLSDTSRDQLLNIMREEFGILFVVAKVDAWLDENILWTTPESRERQQAVFKDLVEIQLPANAKDIGAAAALGDLSENSEWENAVEEQRRLNDRVLKLKNDLSRARVIDPDDVPADSVTVGSRVVLRRTADGERFTLTFLGPWDSNVDQRIYSYQTPLALSLMGQPVGATRQVKVDGVEDEYTIEQTGPVV